MPELAPLRTDITCKATMCRVEVDFPSAAAEDRLAGFLIGPAAVLNAGSTGGSFVRMGAHRRSALYRWHGRRGRAR